MTQFPVNSNIATTGHKLQGQTKKHLIVTSWNYTFPNWVYVGLSRVKNLRGLFRDIGDESKEARDTLTRKALAVFCYINGRLACVPYGKDLQDGSGHREVSWTDIIPCDPKGPNSALELTSKGWTNTASVSRPGRTSPTI